MKTLENSSASNHGGVIHRKSPQTFVIVDGANVFQTAKRFEPFYCCKTISARSLCELDRGDESVRVNLFRLMHLLRMEYEPFLSPPLLVSGAHAGLVPALHYAEKAGFELREIPMKAGSRERGVDQLLTFELGQVTGRYRPDQVQIVLVAGDKDYAPSVRRLVEQSFQIEVLFYCGPEGCLTSQDLREAATSFRALDRAHPCLTFREGSQLGRPYLA